MAISQHPATHVQTAAPRKPGRIASVPDNDGNAAKINVHLEGGGTLRDCPVSVHFRDILKAERPEWWAVVIRQSLANTTARKVRTCRDKMMAKTHCRNGHLLTADTSVVRTLRQGQWQVRRCLICERGYEHTRSYNADDVAKVLESAKAGASMYKLTSYRSSERVMSLGALKNAMRNIPQVDAVLRPLFSENSLHNRTRLITRKPVTRGPTLTGIIAGPAHDVFTAADHAVPRNLDFETRKEVMSEMMLAILEGTLTIEDAPRRWREFLRIANRMFPTKYGPVSLDAPTFHDSKTPLIERISVGLWP
ncbi:hypothetical protein ACNJYD_04385 [Bradyrhizobium sp. DASA03005]|uniref:hypothetical protein n=1 Tax=Bradyrhizobium sp. SPXBL-02 TaxID=3395912 RepID=UPI003F6E6671